MSTNIGAKQEWQHPRTWDLGDGFAVVYLPLRLTPKCIERVRRYAEALAKEAAIGWDEAPPIEQPAKEPSR